MGSRRVVLVSGWFQGHVAPGISARSIQSSRRTRGEMLQLEYLLGGTPGQRREDRIDLAAAPGVELLYSCFVGNVQLVVGGADLSANFGWIPLLNFANNLDLILRRLNANET